MKVCHITDYLPGYHETIGGAEQGCFRYMKILGSHPEVEVRVITTRPSKRENLKKRFDPNAVLTLEDKLGKNLGNLYERAKLGVFHFDPLSLASSRKILEKMEPDIIHFHNFWRLSFSLMLNVIRLNLPTVMTIYDYDLISPLGNYCVNKEGRLCRKFQGGHCHSCRILENSGEFHLPFPYYSFRKVFFDYFLKKGDAFTVLSSSSRQVLEAYGIKKEKIHVIPLPLPEYTKKVEPNPKLMEEGTILFVGYLEWRKGLHILLKAMPKVLEEIPDAKLVVIGSGKRTYEARISSLIENMELQDHVSMLGRRPHSEVLHFLNKSEVVVIPEQWETMGTVFLSEAMTLSKPIVASRIGSIPNIIRDGKTGLLSDPRNPQEFAENIIWLLNHKEKAIKMGKKARERAKKFYNREGIKKELLSLYHKIC